MGKGKLRGRRPLTRHDRNVVFAIVLFVVITAIFAGWVLSLVITRMTALMSVY